MTQAVPLIDRTHALPPGVAAAPSALTLLRALQRRWPVALCLGLLAAISLTAVVRVLVPVNYCAKASVHVAAHAPTREPQPDFPTFIKTQATRIKNRDVLKRALNDPQVRNLPLVRQKSDSLAALLWLDQELNIDYVEGAEFVTVAMHGEDAEQLVVLVNTVVKSYLGLVNGKEQSQRRKRVARMHGVVAAAKEKLRETIAMRQALYHGQGASDAVAFMQKQDALSQQMHQAQKQLGEIHLLLDKAQSRLAAHKASNRPVLLSDISDLTLQTALEADPAVKHNLTLMAELRKVLHKMKAEGHPETESSYRRTKQRYEAVRQEMDEHRQALRKELFERHKEKVEGEFKALEQQLELQVRPLQRQQQLAERLAVLRHQTETIEHAAAKANLLGVEIQRDEQKLAAAQAQLHDLQVEAESEARVTLGQEAAWETLKSPQRLALLVLAPLLGLGGMAVIVAWLEFRARRIHSAEEVVVGLGMRLVGAVPTLPGTRKQRCLIAEDPVNESGQHGAESIDTIRTMLLRNAGLEGIRVVMVTSAVAGEGKTTLSSNLAISLARAGRKTLLVDCDLRGPSAHQLMEQALQPGLSEVLLGEVPLSDAVRPTTTDAHLWLLPAGQWDREVLQQLARAPAQTIFERLREEFDFIVVDSHPVLPATDSLLIGQHVDAVLVSVMHGVSQAPRVFAACERLAALGVKIFGAVVNNMPAEDYADYGYEEPTAVGR